jgi:hypothetical protein
MIQQEYKNNVKDVTGNVETTGFSIEVNESMFQMLTSNVYNDPTLAVMREWSTNACDACIAANTPVNFDVHLPTAEEPVFFVRDYGTGLPPEDIVGLFSNLGASTKRNSNAYNGTLGIGRMAGLAVADAFTVESFYNNTHYSYAISMKDGVPVTMNLGNQPTTEPNGLKLSVTVDYNDINSYVNRAENLYKYFDHKPNLNLEINTELDISEHISDDWFITKNNTGSYYKNNYVVMSQVAYEIPYSREVETHSFEGLVIKAEPGSVTFNPGRETLSLNKQTVEYLNTAFERIRVEYVEAANNALALAANDFELMKTYASLIHAAPRKVAEEIDPTPFMSANYQALFGNRGSYYVNTGTSPSFHYIHMTPTFHSLTGDSLNLSYKSSYYKTAKTLDNTNPQSWQDFFFAKHVIIDLKSKFRSILNEHFSGQNLITWQRKSKDIDESVQAAKNFLDGMGLSYQLASDIVEEQGYQGDIKSIAPREGFYVSEISDGNVYKSEKMDEDSITESTYLCVNLKHTTPIMSGTKDFEDYCIAYNLLLRAGEDMPKIKGVAKKYKGFVEQLDNWLDFESFIEEKMKTAIFREPASTPVPVFTATVFNKENYKTYPLPLQDYFKEVEGYYNFSKDKSYVACEISRQIAKKLGASFVSYEPQYDIDMEQLEKVFPQTLPLLSNRRSDYYQPNPELVSHLAKLEEFYAIHSPER